MSTKFRIGYVYARANNNKQKEIVVILKKCLETGFNKVRYQGKEYKVSSVDNGPKIIDHEKCGLEGELLEIDDEREGIIKGDYFFGQGISMQLALVLAICASYNENEDTLPIMLFSGAISCGKESFVDAKIIPDCQAEKGIEKDGLKKALVSKYNAAKMIFATGIVFVKEHAEILKEEVGKEYYSLANLDLSNKSLEQPLIIGVDSSELPDLAEVLGISAYNYKQNEYGIIGGVLKLLDKGHKKCTNCEKEHQVLYEVSEFHIKKDFTVGRNGNDLNIAASKVISKKHISIHYNKNGNLQVMDHSKNHTQIGDKLLTQNQSIVIPKKSIKAEYSSIICLAPSKDGKIHLKLQFLYEESKSDISSTKSEDNQYNFKCPACGFIMKSQRKVSEIEDKNDR